MWASKKCFNHIIASLSSRKYRSEYTIIMSLFSTKDCEAHWRGHYEANNSFLYCLNLQGFKWREQNREYLKVKCLNSVWAITLYLCVKASRQRKCRARADRLGLIRTEWLQPSKSHCALGDGGRDRPRSRDFLLAVQSRCVGFVLLMTVPCLSVIRIIIYPWTCSLHLSSQHWRCQGRREDGREFKVSLGNIVSSRPVWESRQNLTHTPTNYKRIIYIHLVSIK